MANKKQTSQMDPAEGSREVVDRELKRQPKEHDHNQSKPEPRSAGRPPHEAKEPGAKSVR